MKNKNILSIATLLIFVGATSIAFAEEPASEASTNEGPELFKKYCGKCHMVKADGKKIGRGKTGPDLTGYAEKRSPEFLALYSKDPKAAQTKFPDIYENEIKGKYKTRMKKIDINDAELEQILKLLK